MLNMIRLLKTLMGISVVSTMLLSCEKDFRRVMNSDDDGVTDVQKWSSPLKFNSEDDLILAIESNIGHIQTKSSNEDGGENEFTVTLTNGNTSRFTYYNGHRGSGEKGDKGDKGNGISKILFGNDNSMTVTLDNGDRYQSESLIGPQGLKGEKGDKGDTGAKGDKGEKGETGAVIVPTFQLDERGNLILYYDDPTK